MAARIVAEARIGLHETVLEIGPGRGALTEGLAAAVEAQRGHLVLVELDDDLAAALTRRFERDPRVEVIHEDILRVNLVRLAEPGQLKVVGNIPYNLTSPILFRLLEPPRLGEILLMVQKEVADRILAVPGTRAYGALTVGVRTVADVELVLRAPAEAFRPRPRVDSAVIRILPLEPPRLTPSQEARLRDLTRALFQWRRKQLGKILRDHPDLSLPKERIEALLSAAGVSRSDRPEVVEPKAFRAMARLLRD